MQFEGEDVFWNGSASLLFENLPEQAKIADVMEDEDLRAQYQRDFTEMAEDKEAAAQFVPAGIQRPLDVRLRRSAPQR